MNNACHKLNKFAPAQPALRGYVHVK